MRQTHGELIEPQSVSCDDYTKFVSSLALSVHVEAVLSDINMWESVAVQVQCSVCVVFVVMEFFAALFHNSYHVHVSIMK